MHEDRKRELDIRCRLPRFFAVASGLCQNSGSPPIPAVSDIHQGFIYQIVTDRFFNGDTSNDDPAQSAGEFDPKGFTNPANWRDYWGGDLAGSRRRSRI